MIENYYVVKQVAKLFSKSERTIRRWIEEGLFPNAQKIKGELYVPESDIQKLLTPHSPSNTTSQSTRRILSSGIS